MTHRALAAIVGWVVAATRDSAAWLDAARRDQPDITLDPILEL